MRYSLSGKSSKALSTKSRDLDSNLSSIQKRLITTAFYAALGTSGS